jgi:hypothetical protein
LAIRRWRGFCLFRRAGAFGVGEFLRIGLPAGFDQLLVDQDAGEFFVENQLLGWRPGCFG